MRILALLLAISGCAHRDIAKLNLDECVFDGTQFQCSGDDFSKQHTMPAKEARGWICKAPETDKAYWDACYLQREKNGK